MTRLLLMLLTATPAVAQTTVQTIPMTTGPSYGTSGTVTTNAVTSASVATLGPAMTTGATGSVGTPQERTVSTLGSSVASPAVAAPATPNELSGPATQHR
jgi:hypothetical protein